MSKDSRWATEKAIAILLDATDENYEAVDNHIDEIAEQLDMAGIFAVTSALAEGIRRMGEFPPCGEGQFYGFEVTDMRTNENVGVDALADNGGELMAMASQFFTSYLNQDTANSIILFDRDPLKCLTAVAFLAGVYGRHKVAERRIMEGETP